MSATIPTVTTVTSTKGKIHTNHPVNANQIITLDCEATMLIDNCDRTKYPAIKMNTSDDGDIVWVYPNTPAGEADRTTDCAALNAAINPAPPANTNIYNTSDSLTGNRVVTGGGNNLQFNGLGAFQILFTDTASISTTNILFLGSANITTLAVNNGGQFRIRPGNHTGATAGMVLTLKTPGALNGDSEWKLKTLLTKSAIVAAGSFAASPADFKAVVVFVTAFPDNNYTISITGEDNRNWTVESKTAAGFTINSNNAVAPTGNTFYQAIATGETE